MVATYYSTTRAGCSCGSTNDSSIRWSCSSCSGTTTTTHVSGFGWRRVERATDTNSSYTIYDVYGPDGEHHVEYEYHTREVLVLPPPEEVKVFGPPPLPRPSRRLQRRPAGRRPAILTPPGGWFFFKG